MRIEIPTGARLQNIEAFAKRITDTGNPALDLRIPRSYFSVHPMVLAAIGAAGVRARRTKASVSVGDCPATSSVRYLQRMGLFDLLAIEVGVEVQVREEAGRFIPLRLIENGQQLSNFVVELVPLFHTEPRQAEPIQYVISELVRNTLEHSGPSPAAVVAAQVFPNTGIVGIGVADAGQGIRQSLAPVYETPNDLSAIELAMRPGVTGTTSRVGGTADNAGAGLFFCKAMAYTSRNYFVMHSGRGLFKLLKARSDNPITFIPYDASTDRATRHQGAGEWHGTLVGIDLDVNGYQDFRGFMTFVGDAYDVDVRRQKKALAKKKARFV